MSAPFPHGGGWWLQVDFRSHAPGQRSLAFLKFRTSYITPMFQECDLDVSWITDEIYEEKFSVTQPSRCFPAFPPEARQRRRENQQICRKWLPRARRAPGCPPGYT